MIDTEIGELVSHQEWERLRRIKYPESNSSSSSDGQESDENDGDEQHGATTHKWDCCGAQHGARACNWRIRAIRMSKGS